MGGGKIFNLDFIVEDHLKIKYFKTSVESITTRMYVNLFNIIFNEYYM